MINIFIFNFYELMKFVTHVNKSVHDPWLVQKRSTWIGRTCVFFIVFSNVHIFQGQFKPLTFFIFNFYESMKFAASVNKSVQDPWLVQKRSTCLTTKIENSLPISLSGFLFTFVLDPPSHAPFSGPLWHGISSQVKFPLCITLLFTHYC